MSATNPDEHVSFDTNFTGDSNLYFNVKLDNAIWDNTNKRYKLSSSGFNTLSETIVGGQVAIPDDRQPVGVVDSGPENGEQVTEYIDLDVYQDDDGARFAGRTLGIVDGVKIGIFADEISEIVGEGNDARLVVTLELAKEDLNSDHALEEGDYDLKVYLNSFGGAKLLETTKYLQVGGCMDENANNTYTYASVPAQELCEYSVCQHSNALGYNILSHTGALVPDDFEGVLVHDDSLCKIEGCWDSNACNYSGETDYTKIDDDSCAYNDLTLTVERNNNDADKRQLIKDADKQFTTITNIDTSVNFKVVGSSGCYDRLKLKIVNNGSTTEILLDDENNDGYSYDENLIMSHGSNTITLEGYSNEDEDWIVEETINITAKKLGTKANCSMNEIEQERKDKLCIELGEFKTHSLYGTTMYETFLIPEDFDDDHFISLSTMQNSLGNLNGAYPELDTLYDIEGPILTCSGCMDSTAYNFNDEAVIPDNESCIARVYGCIDPEADFGYIPNANTDDGSCLYDEEPVFGCTDQAACNYNSNANTNIKDGVQVPLSDVCVYINVRLQNKIGDGEYQNVSGSYWLESNPLIQEKDTDNKIHDLKMKLQDLSNVVHNHLTESDLYGKDFTLNDGNDKNLKFLHDLSTNERRVQIESDSNAGTYEFFNIVNYTQVEKPDEADK
jgi:hypothetical protein